VDNAEAFRLIERLVVEAAEAPAWDDLAAELGLPDARWRDYDPVNVMPELQVAWRSFGADWNGVGALWLGIESDSTTYLDPVAYAGLDETGFPQGFIWHAPPLPSDALTEFSALTSSAGESEAYDYGGALAWATLAVRILEPAPQGIPVLVGFGGGDWLLLYKAG
jgi:hypothetical protein